MHELCPKGKESWCKYQRATAKSEQYDHKNHTHFPKVIMEEIKQIFKDLANPDLLRKCLHGGTQNPSESLNSMIFSRIPKSNFVLKSTLEFGVYEVIATFNNSNIVKCRLLKKLEINPGTNSIQTMKKMDEIRIKEAEKAIKELEKKLPKKTWQKENWGIHIKNESAQKPLPMKQGCTEVRKNSLIVYF